MCNLEHVHTVEAGVNSLVAFVICAAVQHFVIDDLVVIAEEDFSDQGEIRL